MSGTPGLLWSIKSSFTQYIERMKDGIVTVSDGAERLNDGVFYFPAIHLSHGPSMTVDFRGAVHFSATSACSQSPSLTPPSW